MPLIDCPACGKQVSSNAPACPNCGEPIKSSIEKGSGGAINPSDPVHLLGIIIAILMAFGFLGFILSQI